MLHRSGAPVSLFVLLTILVSLIPAQMPGVSAAPSSLPAPAPLAQASPPSGLVAAYSFDAISDMVAPDDSGNGHDGTIHGGAWSPQGYAGGALYFDGINDWVEVADAGALDLSSGMTLEAWVYPAGSANYRTVVAKTAASGTAYQLILSPDGSAAGTATTSNTSSSQASSPLPLLRWSYLALTYDGAALTLYVDGTVAATTPVSGAILASDGPLGIGGIPGVFEYFTGRIDEVRVYNRALSAAEIQADQVSPVGTPASSDPADLVAAYGFDEGTGSVVSDQSLYGNDGSVREAVWTAGRYGSALSFDGVNDWVQVPDDPSLDATTAVTVMAWVYPTLRDRWQKVVGKEVINIGDVNYGLYAETDSRLPGGSVSKPSLTGAYVPGVVALPEQSWSHLAVTYDGVLMTLFVNGSAVATRPFTGPLATSDDVLHIGGDGIYGDFYQGRIDEVRIYRRALRDAEIQTDMAAPLNETPGPLPAQPIVPILECVATREDGLYEAAFGYENPNASLATLPIGPLNQFTSGPIHRGQPSSFTPGRSPLYPTPAFSVVFDGSPLSWTLNGQSVTASSASPACPAPPVVDAGLDQVITTTTATLTGALLDDGLPDVASSTWAQTAGPASASITSPAGLSTDVTFPGLGTYTFALSADDTQTTVVDEVTVAVVEAASLPDLRADGVDATDVVVDGQSLAIEGSVEVTVTNIGPGPLPVAAVVEVFEDLDFDGQFDASDNLLGAALLPIFAISTTTTIPVPVEGVVQFAGNRLYAILDRAERIAEADETNNIAHTSTECRPLAGGGSFSPALEWEWIGGTTVPTSRRVITTPMVADLNEDGVPEIIFTSYATNTDANGNLRAISGNGGAEIFTITDPLYELRGTGSLAVGDLDANGTIEILAVAESGNQIIAFNHDGSFRWRSSALAHTINRGGPALADLDGDGLPEVVVGASVLNGADGTIRWSKTTSSGGIGDNRNGPLALVADLDMDGAPEIVAGKTAYRVDGTTYWSQPSTVIDGFPGVGNFDNDAFPELVLVSRGNLYLFNHDGSLIWGPLDLPGSGNGGPPTIADVDADGAPEIGVALASFYVVVEGNGTIRWQQATRDSSSHTTGSSVFDFDGDGAAEVVYADEYLLHIFDGASGTIKWSTPSDSATGYEMPVVVDVDADGNAEIIKASNKYHYSADTSGIQVYGDVNDAWVSTRQIWNQHTYHITNVNDDGTIPSPEANNWESFNNYRQNLPREGCATAHPDLTASRVERSDGASGTTLSARIGNGGGVFVPAGVSVAFYNGDPTTGGTLLGTSETTTALNPGRYETVSLVVLSGTTALPVWVVADDDGTGAGEHTETNEANNRYASRIYLTATPNAAPSVSAGADVEVDLAAMPLSLSGTVNDDTLPINALSVAWEVVSGPGGASFADAASPTTSVSFSVPGTYILRLTASDGERDTADTLKVVVGQAVPPAPDPLGVPLAVPGCIGGPVNQSQVTGEVAITLAAGRAIQDGSLRYWPAHDPSAVTILAQNLTASGGATLATLDTTRLANDSYVIELQATDASGASCNSGVLVTVSGNYKPGRVQFTVTDLSIPLSGFPITIDRTYDSLERHRVGDFGYGWSLSIGSPRLEIDPAHNVTLTQHNGERVTFYFTPQSYGGAFGFFLKPAYTPEPGVYGTLTANGCAIVVQSGSGYLCFLDDPEYAPTTFTYTDPYGTKATMGADGALKSLTDLHQNTLTITPDGITSSAGGVQVPFVRDTQGRITQITDPAGNIYRYEYDAAGDLVEVDLPELTTNILYSYDPLHPHLFAQVTDPRGTTAAISAFYPDGRLQSVTNALGYTTSYTYTLSSRTTTVTQPDGGVTLLQYDPYGMVLRETDALSRTVVYTYTAQRQLAAESNALGHTRLYTYDARGNRTRVVNEVGETTIAGYNQFGGLLSLTDPLSNTLSVVENAHYLPAQIQDAMGILGQTTWDQRGSMLSMTDSLGRTTRYTYDVYGNRLSQTDPLSQTTRYAYDTLGRMIGSTDALSRTTLIEYDALGREVAATNPLGERTRFEYDANGNQVAIVEEAVGNRRTEYEYDAANQLTAIRFPDTSTITYTYDWRGNLLSEKDQDGAVTSYSYDLAGQLIAETRASGTSAVSTIQYEYDAAGRKIREIDPRSFATVYTYDNAGRLVRRTDPLGHTTVYTYNAAGLQIGMRDPAGRETQYTYDQRGRPTQTQHSNGTTSTQVYDSMGQIAQSIDQAGNATSYQFDDIGQLIRVTDAMSATVHYDYDAAGNLTAMVDANGNTTSFAYDGLNRLTRKTWPDDTFEEFTYDSAGNQTSHRRTDGQISTAVYDSMDRLRTVTYFDNQTEVYTYTLGGLRTAVTDLRGTTSYAYDPLQRLTSVTQPDGQALQYSYDSAGNRATMTTSAGTTQYTYDALNRLLTVTDPSAGTFTNTYDALGNRTSLALPNGITTSYGYDPQNRLTNITQRLGATILASYTYTLDPVGNRTRVDQFDGNANSSILWTYDEAYRLTRETWQSSGGSPLLTIDYTYDGNRNRLSQTVNGTTTTYSYNVLDQLLTATTGQEVTAYGYDGRGNLTSISDTSGTTMLTYNAADRLIGVNRPGVTISATYDVSGRRVQQTVNGTGTNYVWDEASRYGDVVLEHDNSGTLIARYVLGGAELLAQERAGTVSYYLHDGQTSVRALANSAGTITDRYDYTAYGEEQSRSGTTVNPYTYASQQQNAETGLHYLRARWYDPSSGRFLSRDTFPLNYHDPVEHNRYGYARANPIRYIDPSGYSAITVQYRQAFIPTTKVKVALAAAGLGAACVYLHTASLVAAMNKDGIKLIVMRSLQPQPCSIPVFIWPRYTEVGQHIHDAQFLLGKPMLLHYDGINDHDKKRRRLTRTSPNCKPHLRQAGQECDEYPYASTWEGGKTNGASTRLVAGIDNSIHGGMLGSFYEGGFTNHWNRSIQINGHPFAVVILP